MILDLTHHCGCALIINELLLFLFRRETNKLLAVYLKKKNFEEEERIAEISVNLQKEHITA